MSHLLRIPFAGSAAGGGGEGQHSRGPPPRPARPRLRSVALLYRAPLPSAVAADALERRTRRIFERHLPLCLIPVGRSLWTTSCEAKTQSDHTLAPRKVKNSLKISENINTHKSHLTVECSQPICAQGKFEKK